MVIASVVFFIHRGVVFIYLDPKFHSFIHLVWLKRFWIIQFDYLFGHLCYDWRSRWIMFLQLFLVFQELLVVVWIGLKSLIQLIRKLLLNFFNKLNFEILLILLLHFLLRLLLMKLGNRSLQVDIWEFFLNIDILYSSKVIAHSSS